MYYIERLKTTLEEIAASYETACSGILSARLRGHPMWLIAESEPEIALLERFSAVCDGLGIDPDNLAELETFISDEQYRSDKRELQGRIERCVGEIREATLAQEEENAVTLLEAAGFTFQQDDSYEGWVRGTEQISTKYKHKGSDSWYEFLLKRNGDGILTGRSGEFSKLLAAVGISVEASKCT